MTPDEAAELDALRDEVARLLRWKREASPVMVGLQDVGRALGLPPGTSITGPDAAEAAGRLRAQVDAAAALAEKWDTTPDCAPNEYDQGRVDQRHDMTAELLEVLAARPTVRERIQARAVLAEHAPADDPTEDDDWPTCWCALSPGYGHLWSPGHCPATATPKPADDPTRQAAAQAGVCMWTHDHGPHDIPALIQDPQADRVLHLDPVNTIRCGGRGRLAVPEDGA